MRKENGLTLVALVITIIILLILAGVTLNMVLGDNGILAKATTVEEEFNKSEVLEELNLMITEKYLDAYNKDTRDGNTMGIEQYYDAEKVIQFLKGYSGGESGDDYTTQDSKVVIEDLAGATDMYFIKIAELNRSISTYGKGQNVEGSKDYFYIKKESEEVYKVYYKNLNQEIEEIGQLQIQQKI